MTTKKLLEALRADVAELRKEVAELKAQRCPLVAPQPCPPVAIPAFPHYPLQPTFTPWYPPQPTVIWQPLAPR